MNIIVSNFLPTPIYEQIKNQIKEYVLRSELKQGEQLPSIRIMAKDLKVSVITVKHAYDELEREKIVELIPGKGCFVCGIDLETIKNANIEILRERLCNIVSFGKNCGITKTELEEITKEIYDGGN